MTRIGRGSDWLGDASDESFLSHSALPRKSRDVKFDAIRTAADAREYARRFFHGAVDAAAKLPKSAADVRGRWALAAKQYVLAHDLAGQGGALADVKAGLQAADLNSAAAIEARKVNDQGKRLGLLRPAVLWFPPATDAAPAPTPARPVAGPGGGGAPPPAPAPPRPATGPTQPPAPRPAPVPAPTVPAPRPAPPVAVPGTPLPALPGGAGATEPAPPTDPDEWLVAGLLPKHSRKLKLEQVRTLADAEQYARRFFAGAVDHGTAATDPAIRQRWAEAARIYVYAHRLAADPFIEGALAAVENDLRAADILSAQAIAAEKGGALAPVTVRWFTSPELAERGLATFELVGNLKSPATPPTIPASLETPAGLPRTFDAIIDRFRGAVPLAFVRALIMAESSFNPTSQHPESDARGLLQVTPIVLKDWNASHPADQVTPDQLFDPSVNIKLGLNLLRHIVESYDKNHPTMRMNWRSARYVEVIAEAWNVGYSEAAGVGLILSHFERSGIDSTVENIVARGPQVPGVGPKLAERLTTRGVKFPKRVRELYFGELSRGEGIFGRQLLTAGLNEDAAFVVYSGVLLLGDDIFGRRS